MTESTEISAAPTAVPDGWNTGITYTAPGVIAPRGYPIEQLMGAVTFTDVVHLMHRGELPDARTRALLDAILVASIDHSTTSPSAMTARTVASSGSPVQVAATAGLLAINTYHGGALEPCMTVLRQVIAAADESADSDDLTAAAARVAAEWRRQGLRIPGFGHRVHAKDPRTDRLFAIADELGFSTRYDDAARAMATVLTEHSGKPIPMNLDGAIAAILCGLGYPQELANPLFMISRFVGITMQAYEEHTRQRPMRKIYLDRFAYDGVDVRQVPTNGADHA
jgi:citrate synthase